MTERSTALLHYNWLQLFWLDESSLTSNVSQSKAWKQIKTADLVLFWTELTKFIYSLSQISVSVFKKKKKLYVEVQVDFSKRFSDQLATDRNRTIITFTDRFFLDWLFLANIVVTQNAWVNSHINVVGGGICQKFICGLRTNAAWIIWI